MKNNWLLVSLLILCSACNSPVQINDFHTVVEISHYDSLYSDKYDLFGTVKDIAIADTVIILQTSHNDYAFFFIDAQTGSTIGKWGRTGRGNNEYLQVSSTFSICDSMLTFLDTRKKEIIYLPIANIVDGTHYSVIKEPYPYTAGFRPQQITPLRNHKIVLGALESGRFGVLNAENEIVGCPFDYYFEYPQIQGIFRGSVFQSKMKANPDLNRFVVQTLVSDNFEIFDATSSDIKKIYTSCSNLIPAIIEKPRPGVSHTIDYNRSKCGLMRMAASKQFIYFTYSDHSYSESAQNGLESDEILCFDWDGNKKQKYILPFRISGFCVDEHYIYGVRNMDGDNIICRFPIN